jgi:hypothetical protein
LSAALASFETKGLTAFGKSETSTFKGLQIDLVVADEKVPNFSMKIDNTSLNGLDITPLIAAYEELFTIFEERGDPDIFNELFTYASFFVYPYNLESMTVNGIDLKMGNGWSAKMDSFDFIGPVLAGKLSGTTTKGSGLSLDFTTNMDWPYFEDTKEVTDFLGISSVTIDFDLQTEFLPEKNTTNFIVNALTFKDYFTLSGNMAFDGLNQRLIDALAAFPMYNTEPQTLVFMIPELSTLGLAEYNLTIDNSGLLALILDIYTRDKGGTPEAVIAQLQRTLEMVKEEILAGDEAFKGVNIDCVEAARSFFDDPKKISLKVAPSFPLSAMSLQPYTVPGADSDEVVYLIGINLAVNDGPFIPLYKKP